MCNLYSIDGMISHNQHNKGYNMNNSFHHKGFIVEFVETHHKFKYTKVGYWTARRTVSGEVVIQNKELGPVLKAIKKIKSKKVF